MNEWESSKPGSDNRAIVALGANLPHAGLAGAPLLAAAIRAMVAANVRVLAVSSAWRSPAWPPGSNQPDYVNAVAAIGPEGWTPQSLLARLLEIERAFGRERGVRWAARTMDLDIVDFAGLTLAEAGLTLPHPRVAERAFVLAPLAEIAPRHRFPNGKSALTLLQALGPQPIERLGPLPDLGPLRDCETPGEGIS